MKNRLVYLRPARLVYVRVTGPYETSIPAAWQRMFAWLDKHAVSVPVASGYGMMRDNPNVVGAEGCRYDACVDLNPLFEERAIRELGAQTLPGGSYARVRNVGNYEDLRSRLLNFHTSFEAPQGLKLDDRRPLVTIYLDDPRRLGVDSLRADICVPVSARVSRVGEQEAREAA